MFVVVGGCLAHRESSSSAAIYVTKDDALFSLRMISKGEYQPQPDQKQGLFPQTDQKEGLVRGAQAVLLNAKIRPILVLPA